MNSGHKNNDQLEKLTDRLLDGRITDAEVAALDEILLENQPAQDYLLEHCQFHAMLTFDLHVEKAMAKVVQRCEQGRVAPKVTSATARISKVGVVASMALAASLLLAVGVFLFQRSVDSVAISKYVPTSSPELASIKLASGSTQLALANFGSVTLEGPAEFEMLGPMRARLHHGRIKVRITDPRGHGFVVEMPHGEVTDLGTEFGLDVSEKGGNGLVVFEGAVGLRVPASPSDSSLDSVQRLEKGDGVVVNQQGQIDRIVAIFTGPYATFGQLADSHALHATPVIVDVKDNLRTAETKKYYEIVPRGLDEDAISYVDRPNHEWNGVDEKGLPDYLIGADYVKPFNNDKMRKDFQLLVTLSQPARLFVIFDDRIPVPDWLERDFQDTGDDVGIDMGEMMRPDGRFYIAEKNGVGPGVSIDSIFSVWERVVSEPSTVVLGPNAGQTSLTAMYAVAAVALDSPDKEPVARSLSPFNHLTILRAGKTPQDFIAPLRERSN